MEQELRAISDCGFRIYKQQELSYGKNENGKQKAESRNSDFSDFCFLLSQF